MEAFCCTSVALALTAMQATVPRPFRLAENCPFGQSVSLSKAFPGSVGFLHLTWSKKGGWTLWAFLLQGPLVLLPAVFLISTHKRRALVRKKFPKQFQLWVPTTCVI